MPSLSTTISIKRIYKVLFPAWLIACHKAKIPSLLNIKRDFIMTRENDTTYDKKPSAPTHAICKKTWNGKRTEFETLGVAWRREDGGLYIKLHGTQIVEGGFYAFPNKDTSTTEGGQ